VQRALSGHGGYVLQCNVHVLMTAQDDARLKEAMDEAWCVMPDGAPVAWLMRKFGASGAQRIGGPDLMSLVLDRGREHDLRHVFVGSTPEVLAALRANLATRYAGLKIVGTISPPYTAPEDWSGALISELQELRPHLIWLALGAPKQELWLGRYGASLTPGLSIAVGAAFDFESGQKVRAPGWMQRMGLEWVHRLLSEPRRLARRYAATNARFTALSIVAYITRQRHLR
jgi:N-acetylglucosaminyldiphosphoundecaprenol N-acetyl-beta-D-mannosaminyltransferase